MLAPGVRLQKRYNLQKTEQESVCTSPSYGPVMRLTLKTERLLSLRSKSNFLRPRSMVLEPSQEIPDDQRKTQDLQIPRHFKTILRQISERIIQLPALHLIIPQHQSASTPGLIHNPTWARKDRASALIYKASLTPEKKLHPLIAVLDHLLYCVDRSILSA
jgi:hypothetical protein